MNFFQGAALEDTHKLFNAAGITRLEQLTRVSESEIKKLHGMGPNGLKQLREALEARGLSFAEGKSRKERE